MARQPLRVAVSSSTRTRSPRRVASDPSLMPGRTSEPNCAPSTPVSWVGCRAALPVPIFAMPSRSGVRAVTPGRSRTFFSAVVGSCVLPSIEMV